MSTTRVQKGDVIRYTPASTAVESGDVLVIGTFVGVALEDIAVGATGNVEITGVHLLRKVSGAVTQGALMYWDPDGNPSGGTTGSGCMTTTSATGNTLAGKAMKAAAETDTHVEVKLNV